MPRCLNEPLVTEMRARYRSGQSCFQIAARFAMSWHTVRDAIWGISWAAVPGAVGPDERRPNGNQKGAPFNVAFGERHGMSKLTEETVLLARRLYAEGQTGMAIARMLGLSDGTVYAAISGKSWSHVPGGLDMEQIRRERRERNPPPPTPKRGRGEALRGADNGQAKLSDQAVADARDRYRQGESISAIAERLGVSKQTMGSALKGETWSHVPSPLADPCLQRGRRPKLDDADVLLARTLYRAGATMSSLAQTFAVSLSTMSCSLRGVTSSHVPLAVTVEELRMGRPPGPAI
jgi:hypothetical protein